MWGKAVKVGFPLQMWPDYCKEVSQLLIVLGRAGISHLSGALRIEKWSFISIIYNAVYGQWDFAVLRDSKFVVFSGTVVFALPHDGALC